jgi:hypothetical protein
VKDDLNILTRVIITSLSEITKAEDEDNESEEAMS